MHHFENMFRVDCKTYIERITEKVKPHKTLVCMIYFPDEKQTGSWSDTTLGYLGYNKNPSKLQEVIKGIYKLGTCRIELEGTEFIPFPLFQVLDGKDTKDYVQRVL